MLSHVMPFAHAVPLHTQDLLSQPELDAAREYDELLQNYMDAVGTDLCKCMQPPKSVRIAVKAKENWGSPSEKFIPFEDLCIR